MKRLLFIMILSFLVASLCPGQTKKNRTAKSVSDLLPIKVVSPVYPVAMMQTNVTGSVVVSIKVNKKGDVTEARRVKGLTSLGKISERAAKKWVFNFSDKKATRTVELTFIYKLISADSPYDEANVVYFSPFTMEIKGIMGEIEP